MLNRIKYILIAAIIGASLVKPVLAANDSAISYVSINDKVYYDIELMIVGSDEAFNLLGTCEADFIISGFTYDSESFEITNLCDELTSADKSLVDISAASNGLVWCVTDNSSVYFVANSQKALVDIDGSDGSAARLSAEELISLLEN